LLFNKLLSVFGLLGPLLLGAVHTGTMGLFLEKLVVLGLVKQVDAEPANELSLGNVFAVPIHGDSLGRVDVLDEDGPRPVSRTWDKTS
jgi:hypothetical protein